MEEHGGGAEAVAGAGWEHRAVQVPFPLLILQEEEGPFIPHIPHSPSPSHLLPVGVPPASVPYAPFPFALFWET